MFGVRKSFIKQVVSVLAEVTASWGRHNEQLILRCHNQQMELLMLNQQALDDLTARIKAMEPKVDALEAAQQPPLDATALTAEVATLEAQFAANPVTAPADGSAPSGSTPAAA